MKSSPEGLPPLAGEGVGTPLPHTLDLDHFGGGVGKHRGEAERCKLVGGDFSNPGSSPPLRAVWGPGVVSVADLNTVACVDQKRPWVVMVSPLTVGQTRGKCGLTALCPAETAFPGARREDARRRESGPAVMSAVREVCWGGTGVSWARGDQHRQEGMTAKGPPCLAPETGSPGRERS